MTAARRPSGGCMASSPAAAETLQPPICEVTDSENRISGEGCGVGPGHAQALPGVRSSLDSRPQRGKISFDAFIPALGHYRAAASNPPHRYKGVEVTDSGDRSRLIQRSFAVNGSTTAADPP